MGVKMTIGRGCEDDAAPRRQSGGDAGHTHILGAWAILVFHRSQRHAPDDLACSQIDGDQLALLAAMVQFANPTKTNLAFPVDQINRRPIALLPSSPIRSGLVEQHGILDLEVLDVPDYIRVNPLR